MDGSGTILAIGQVNTGTPGSYVLSFNYTDAAGNAAQTVTRTVQWWTQPLRLSVYLGMPILRTREEVRTLMPMRVGQMRWMEAERYWQADSQCQ